MNDEIIKFDEVINNTFKNIKVENIKNARNIVTSWEKVLMRIKSNINENEGRNIASHTRVLDLKNGILLVEADHPGWIELVQLHKKFILKGLKMEVPELKIETLAFKLKGKKGELSEVRENINSEEERKKLQRKLEEEEVEMNKVLKYSEKKNKVNNLPPELASIFEDLKKSMEERESLT